MKIKEVRYLVTGAFADCSPGEIRRAYLVGGDDLSGPVMLFHPKERGGCGSLELCRHPPHKQKSIDGMPLYASLGKESYVNLTSQQSKQYEAMITTAGLTLHKNYDLPGLSLAKPFKYPK